MELFSPKMESQKQQGNSSKPSSEIAEFYNGKSLFITGATGFVGSVLLEALLRCCPGICRIYILLRPKKGVQVEDRMENIFKKKIFYKIKEKYPNVLNKVVVIPGDTAHDNLGMSSEDLYKVSQEVSIVFHCAAVISFCKPLRFMIQQNVIGVYNIIEFSKKLKKLDVLAYTSTAFSNCNNMSNIEERIYKLPFTTEEILRTFRTAGDEELMSYFIKCKPKFPNFYTFTKSVCETLIAEQASDLPIFIVRPSLIISCFKGPLPGYVEEGTALTNLALGVGKGFIRVVRCDSEKVVNMIPVDVVANAHIIGAYRQIADNLPSSFVYNCVMSRSKAWTWNTFINHLFKTVQKNSLPDVFQNPSLTVCNSNVKYWIFSVFDHYAPAFVIDCLLWLSGRKPRLLKLYRFYETNMKVARPFMENEWTFDSEHFQSLGDKLNAMDKELFPCELTSDLTIENICKSVVTGSPMFQKDYDKPHNKNLRPKYVPLYLTSLIKWIVLGGLASTFYIALF